MSEARVGGAGDRGQAEGGGNVGRGGAAHRPAPGEQEAGAGPAILLLDVHYSSKTTTNIRLEFKPVCSQLLSAQEGRNGIRV